MSEIGEDISIDGLIVTMWVELTDAGRRYFERCAHLVDEARLAQEELKSKKGPVKRVKGARLELKVGIASATLAPVPPASASPTKTNNLNRCI